MPDLDFLRRIKKLVITAIFSDKDLFDLLVLKGGNLLDVAYELSGRASVDVDLSMDTELEHNVLKDKVESALQQRFNQEGYHLFDFTFRNVPPKLSDDMKDFWGGYKVDFKIIEQTRFEKLGDLEQIRRHAIKVGKKDSPKFKIDISRHEYCDDKEQFDIDGTVIYGYSPKLFVAEKLRAICQQMREYSSVVHSNPSPRARDFVDIHIISNHYGISWEAKAFLDVVRKVFLKKKVPLVLLRKIRETHEFHNAGFHSVQASVLPGFDLQEFDFYFQFVCKKSVTLKPLWDI